MSSSALPQSTLTLRAREIGSGGRTFSRKEAIPWGPGAGGQVSPHLKTLTDLYAYLQGHKATVLCHLGAIFFSF